MLWWRDVRRRYNVNILGVKTGDEVEPLLDPTYRFEKDSHLLIAGDKEDGTALDGARLKTDRAGSARRRRTALLCRRRFV